MYCVKYKQKTESQHIEEAISKNNRRMVKSMFSICGSKKCQFIKNTIGKGIGDFIINAIGKVGELHLPADKGEHVPNGSFNNLQSFLIAVLEQNMTKEIEKVIRQLMNWIKCVNCMISSITKIIILQREI